MNYIVAFRKIFSNRPFTGAVFYVVCLYIFEEWLFDFPQAKSFQQLIVFSSRDEILIAFGPGVASLVFLGFFVWVVLKSSSIFQVFYITLFALSSLVQYGYWKAVERFVISADLRIAAATPIDTWKGAGVLFFDWRFILPVVGLVCLLFLSSERDRLKPDFIKFGYIFLFLLLLSLSHTFTRKSLNLGLSFSSFYQTIADFVIDSVLPPERETIEYDHPDVPENNIVLVIDESIRGDHLGLNGYGRDTTPFFSVLESTEKGFYNFGLAVAGATCSYSSNALILTGVRPGWDEFELTASYPTAFQYAKAMGYKTYYMDAQTNSFWNGLTDRDLSFIDSWLKARDFGNDIEGDFRAADKIVEIVSQSPGNFIVLNKRGVHFLYESSYPPESAAWLPVPGGDYAKHPDLVSNPYDNGILYNVNTFFERLLIDREILENTTILYTSDHGQTLFENHASWLHCNDTPQEATVPLILIGRRLPQIVDSSQRSHSTILPTLLDLMGLPTNQRVHPYSPSLFSVSEDSSMDRFFFDGSLRLIRFPDN